MLNHERQRPAQHQNRDEPVVAVKGDLAAHYDRRAVLPLRVPPSRLDVVQHHPALEQVDLALVRSAYPAARLFRRDLLDRHAGSG